MAADYADFFGLDFCFVFWFYVCLFLFCLDGFFDCVVDWVFETEEYLKVGNLIVLIIVPYGSPYWDFFYNNTFLKLIEPSQQFLKRYEELFGKNAFITFLLFF